MRLIIRSVKRWLITVPAFIFYRINTAISLFGVLPLRYIVLLLLQIWGEMEIRFRWFLSIILTIRTGKIRDVFCRPDNIIQTVEPATLSDILCNRGTNVNELTGFISEMQNGDWMKYLRPVIGLALAENYRRVSGRVRKFVAHNFFQCYYGRLLRLNRLEDEYPEISGGQKNE